VFSVAAGCYTVCMNNTDDELKRKQRAIWPEVIGVVITKSGEQVNLCPVNFQAVSTVFEKPLTVCIGLMNNSFSLETILKTGQFVYAYPAARHLKDVLYCGSVSGRSADKIAYTAAIQFDLPLQGEVPVLKDAVANFECKLVHSYDRGDFTVVIGEIVAHQTVGEYTLDKIYSLGGQNFGVIREVDILTDHR